jgi:hypothetical protein
MKAFLIKTLSNKIDELQIQAGQSLKNTFNGFNLDDCIIIINGKKCTDESRIIKESDIVYIRLLPKNSDSTPWFVKNFIVPFGFIIYPAIDLYNARKEAQRTADELEKIKKLTNASVDNRPFLRGATNTVATGKSQPYICGRHFFTPYLFSKPFYKISGTDGSTQEVYNILEGGFAGLNLNKLGIGDTVIKDWGADTSVQNGYFTISDGVFANGIVEIRQDGELFSQLPELNYKIISNSCNTEIGKASDVSEGSGEYPVFTLDTNAKAFDLAITFPNGLYAYNNDNDRISTSCEIIVEYSLDNGVNYTPLQFPNGNTFTKNTLKEIRYVINHEFTLADYQTLYNNNATNILIRCRSNGNTDSNVINTCYVLYYQSYCYDPNKSSVPAGVLDDGGIAGLINCLNVEDRERSKSCIIGLKLTATENNKEKLTQINIIGTNTARTWNGTAWTETKAPTRNPAAIALEILTTDLHPASRFLDNEIDLESFGDLYEYCETNDLHFDYVVNQGQKKDDILSLILASCNAAMYIDIYGRRAIAIDQKQENAIAVYNAENIVDISNKKTLERRIDALRVKYTDSTNDTYKENTYLVKRIENGHEITIDEDSIIKDITATGITCYDQVVKYARRQMATAELRQIITTINIGNEGIYYTPLSKVSISDKSLQRSVQSSVIDSVRYYGGLLKSIKLRSPVQITANAAYGVIINCINNNKITPLALKVNAGTGDSITELEIADSYSISESIQPEANNIITIGELDADGDFTTVKHDYIITKIARTSDGYSLDCVEYNTAIYDDGTIPAYKPIVNNVPVPTIKEIPPDYATKKDIAEKQIQINDSAMQAAIDTITQGYTYTNVYNIQNLGETLDSIIAKIDDDARDASASISISTDEILLQVSDMERELIGLLDIQAGAVTALVEGGGATGQLSLSLNLPVMLDAAKRQQLIDASSETRVNAVYGLVTNTDYYGIKGNASTTAIKALWDDAVQAGLIASQLDLSATQIRINGDNIYINGDTMFEGEVGVKKIKAALVEVENLLARDIAVKDKGVIHSDTYNGTIDNNGNITAYGSTGWAIDHSGKSDFANIHASGEISATDLSITCRAGDVIFRKLFAAEYDFNTITTGAIYSQIIATGVISVNIKTTPITTGNPTKGGVIIYKVKDSVETLIRRVNFEDTATNIREDVTIDVGDSIKIELLKHAGGAYTATNRYNLSVTLSSDRSQSILAYLGAIKSVDAPEPAR